VCGGCVVSECVCVWVSVCECVWEGGFARGNKHI